MTTSNTYGRAVDVPMVNKTGGGVVLGDVVIYDTTNNDAFTTTTSAGSTLACGVAQETIASNATGRIRTLGYTSLVNVNASVTRGHYGYTHTVAKQATDAGAVRLTGTFLYFQTGGTTPDAIIYPVDLAGSALTNPMTTQGDIIYGGASGTPTRLAVGAANALVMSDGTNPGYVALAAGSATRTAGDITTTSTTFVDATGMSVTITTGARRCLVVVQANAKNSGTGATCLDLTVDSTRQGQAFGLAFYGSAGVNNENYPLSFSFITAALSAGSHTFKVQWRVDSGTGTLYASTTVSPLSMQVMELPG